MGFNTFINLFLIPIHFPLYPYFVKLKDAKHIKFIFLIISLHITNTLFRFLNKHEGGKHYPNVIIKANDTSGVDYMLNVNITPNCAGLQVDGDFYDFDQLYIALHEIVGEEDEYTEYSAVRIRVLGFCYDLRHANMGDRKVVHVDNGLTNEILKYHGIVGVKKNLYLSFNTYLPEILFITMALNDFIKLYEKKVKHPIWNETIATVRILQSKITGCLEKILTPHKFKMMMNTINPYWQDYVNYATQYLDLLNIRFLDWDSEKRLKNINIIAKRLAEKGEEYQSVKKDVYEAAVKNDTHPNEMELKIDYPEEINW